MSVTIICLYIISAMFIYLFFHYKFLKLFENTSTLSIFTKSKMSNKCGIWSIPGPMNIPFVGTKWIFLWQYKMSQIHKTYEDFHKRFGPIALEVTPSGIPIVHLFARQDIEKVLRYPSKYPFRPPTEIISHYRQSRPDRYASVGIVNEQGEQWLNLRSKLTPHILSPRIVQAILPTLNEISDDFITMLKWKRSSDNVVENFQDCANLMGLEGQTITFFRSCHSFRFIHFISFSFSAICTLILGRRMGFMSHNPPNKARILATSVKEMFAMIRDSYYGFGLWKYFPTQTYRKFVEHEETIYNIVSEIVDASMANESFECDDNDVKSVFFKLMQEKDLDIREKKSAIIDFISAGIETLANTLAFVLFYTTRDPKIQVQIRDEIDNCDNDFSRAFFTKACILEVFRLTPTAFCLARLLEEDTNLSGYDLKAGVRRHALKVITSPKKNSNYFPIQSIVLCHTMIACNDESNFINAKKFEPERWIDYENKRLKLDLGSALVVPFGIGKRTCPGKRFVELELIAVLSKLFSAFDVSYCGELKTEFEFLLVPKTPVNIKLVDR
ncbi:Ecdysone 20-monooxygenase [Pseudolycoriella hygida]|uniref:Ecdysone 20-monooxygenase n=1 Tax=Pseudolycoriella hygida TaxID=35572 RepID=A0A9Q0RUJ9_9DIPT|nr:Ecdysone 20-monooxygenase [Pseudolycoriella hygida]